MLLDTSSKAKSKIMSPHFLKPMPRELFAGSLLNGNVFENLLE